MRENPAGHDNRRRRLRTALVLFAVVLVLAVGTTVVLLRKSGDDDTAQAPSTGTTTTSVPTSSSTTLTTTTSGTALGSTSTAVPVSTTAGPGTTTGAPVAFGHQPLWPFATQAEASMWQRAYRMGGHQAWHLDPAATASAFTTGYLGFTGLGSTTSNSVVGRDAWIGVGYPVEGRAPTTAAVVHLARFGSGDDAPWEVVGTRDSTFSLTSPGYGTVVGSPVAVGGRITGVDENIRVRVLHLGTPSGIGDACCLPAGGTDTAWNTTVAFRGPGTGALTIVASTGGHYTDVERFAVTGVTAAPGTA